MATNYDNLKTTLQAKANELSDDTDKYSALILVDQYIAALTAQASATASNVTSYSIAGRSVTKSGGQDYAQIVNDLKAQLNHILYGNVTYADFRINNEELQSL